MAKARQNFRRQAEEQGPASVPGVMGREWAPFRIPVKINPQELLTALGSARTPCLPLLSGIITNSVLFLGDIELCQLMGPET